jgi:Glycosyl hydrolase family 47
MMGSMLSDMKLFFSIAADWLPRFGKYESVIDEEKPPITGTYPPSGRLLTSFSHHRRSRSRLRRLARNFLQPRIRYAILAGVTIFLLFSSFTRVPLHDVQRRYQIQANFPSESRAAKGQRLYRQAQVKEAFQHAWRGYKAHAWLHDEVLPISSGHKDTFVGWAATLVDGLDTLWIMGLKDEWDDALKALENIDFSKPNAERIPVFETTIRYLGGLLGAWDISEHQYPILLTKATQLGDLLFKSFDTQSGAPVPYYWWEHPEEHHTMVEGKMEGNNNVLVAQIGSLSLEFIRLSQVSGDPKYANAIQKVTDELERTQNITSLPGIWPTTADCAGKELSFSSLEFTLGAWAGMSSFLPFLVCTIICEYRKPYTYIQCTHNQILYSSIFPKHTSFSRHPTTLINISLCTKALSLPLVKIFSSSLPYLLLQPTYCSLVTFTPPLPPQMALLTNRLLDGLTHRSSTSPALLVVWLV